MSSNSQCFGKWSSRKHSPGPLSSVSPGACIKLQIPWPQRSSIGSYSPWRSQFAAFERFRGNFYTPMVQESGFALKIKRELFVTNVLTDFIPVVRAFPGSLEF